MLSGREMCRYLVSVGVVAQKVVRKRETGDYVADFYVPQLNEPIPPAREWAKRIQRIMSGVQILETHDTLAPWREGNPVIYASVVFRFEMQDVA